MNWLRNLLWQLRVRNRILLAWWAFRNPDNLTFLRHEMWMAADNVPNAKRFGHNKIVYHGTKCSWWLQRYFNLPVH